MRGCSPAPARDLPGRERMGALSPLTAEGATQVEQSHKPCLRQLKCLSFLYRPSSAQESLKMESFRGSFQRNGLREGFLCPKGYIKEV